MSNDKAQWFGQIPAINLYDFVMWNSSQELQAYKFDGTDILTEGNASAALTIATANRGGVSALTNDSVAVTGSDGFNDREMGKYVFDGDDWTLQGNILILTNSFPYPAGMTPSRICNNDFSNISAYDFDGTDWSLEGTAVPSPAGDLDSRDAFSIVRFSSTNNLEKRIFTGTTWVTQKTTALGFTAAGMCSLTTSRVAVLDTTNNELKTFDEGASSYTQVGNGFSITGLGVGCLTALGAGRVVFGDNANNELRVLDFDGTDWSQVGNTLTSAGVPEGSNLAAGSYLVLDEGQPTYENRFEAVVHDSAPYITNYDIGPTDDPPSQFPAPVDQPTGNGNGVDWSPSGQYLAIAHNTTPFVTIYDWVPNNFPNKITNPAALPAGNGQGAAWSPDGRFLAIAHTTTPFITIYDWDSGSPVKVTDPVSLPGSNATDCKFSPDGRYLTVTESSSPYVATYDFGTGGSYPTLPPVKIADPATLPGGAADGVAWSPDGTWQAIGHAGSPFITIYDWTSGVPVKEANPASLPPATCSGVDFDSTSRYLAVACDSSPFILVYDFDTGSPVKEADPASLPPSSAHGVGFRDTGEVLAVAGAGSPYLTNYDYSSFPMVELTDVSPNPGSICRDVKFGRTQ